MRSFVLFVYGLSFGYGLLRPTATATIKSPDTQLGSSVTDVLLAAGRALTAKELNHLRNDSTLQVNMLTYQREIEKRGVIQKETDIDELKNFANELNEGEFI